MNLLLRFLFLLPVFSFAQEYDQSYFRSPVDYEIVLSGSFAELRNNHFHAGIDIKPSGKVEADTIFASAEGFISRIKVERGGYGRVIYIDHPNGYTTVYAHLDEFNDTITSYISTLQKQAQSYEVDIYPKKGSLLINKGDALGTLGNTGRSYGPHLHYEIRETATEIPVNPFLFGLKPKDDRSPVLMSYSVYGLDPDYHQEHMETVYLSKNKAGKYGPSKTLFVPSWRAGVAIQCYDLMNGAANHNGIYSIETYLDDTLIHSVRMDKVGFHESGYIKSYTDFQQRKKYKRWAVRCYRHPGNILNVYDSLQHNGIFPIYKGQARKVRIDVADIEGNSSSIDFSVQRKEGEKPLAKPYNLLIQYDRDTTFRLSEAYMKFPIGTLDKDYYFTYQVDTLKDGNISHTFGDIYTPIFQYIEMGIRPIGLTLTSLANACIVQKDDDKITSFGGTFDGHYLTAYVDRLGPFSIALDTIAPEIIPKKYTALVSKPDYFTFILRDNYEVKGRAEEIKYDVWIDGKWLACPLKSLTEILTVPLQGLGKGDHELMIEAVDDKNNKGVFRSTFTIQ